jgi:hypothetical protein
MSITHAAIFVFPVLPVQVGSSFQQRSATPASSNLGTFE